MGSTIRLITGLSYRKIIKPILFTQSPDSVHSRIIKVGSFVQRSSLVRASIQFSWAHQGAPCLQQDLHNVHFSNPVGLSAGFDKNFELPPLLKAVGFGFMEGGSLTFEECLGNPRPWFYRLPKTKALVVHAGLANQGVDKQIERITSYKPDVFSDFPLIVSVAKTNSPVACDDEGGIADYVGSLKKLKISQLGQFISINISCPNTFGGEPFTTPARLDRLLTAIDSVKLSQPVLIKMPIDKPPKEFLKLVAVADKHKVVGLIIGNLAKERSHMKLKDSLPDTVKGGVSGSPTRDLSNRLIQETYRNYRNRFFIIGVGGVMSAEQAYTKIRLGASLVSLITGMIFEGPQLIGDINKGLEKLLKNDGFDTITEAIGIDAVKI